MEVSALRMHANRALYADVSLHNALKRLHALYKFSKAPASEAAFRSLQHDLAGVYVELFDDVWGIGVHRMFQNAFRALMLEPQGNPQLWNRVWKQTQSARVTLRQTLFSKQIEVRKYLSVDTSEEVVAACTSFLQTDLPSMSASSIDEPYVDSLSNPDQPMLPDEYANSDPVQMVISSF